MGTVRKDKPRGLYGVGICLWWLMQEKTQVMKPYGA